MKMKMEIVVLNILNFDIDKIFIVAIVCWCVWVTRIQYTRITVFLIDIEV